MEYVLEETAKSRFPVAGDKVKFLNKNGYPDELRNAQLTFEPWVMYTVEACEVGAFNHFIKISGNWWNGVMFEAVKP